MNDEYLWDRSGEPDPDGETLERRLSVLAQGAPPPRVLPERFATRPDMRLRARFRAALAVAAALAVVASGV